MKLEEKLVSLRKAKGLSQMKLAEMMNVSRQAISRWEIGAAVPSTDNLKYLGRLYDVPLEYLLHDDAPEPKDNVTADPAGASVVQRKTFRRRFLIVIVSLLVMMGMITCIYVYQNKEEVVPIDELTDDANWESSEADEFSLDW